MLAFHSAINAAPPDTIPAEAILFTYGAISNASWTFTAINTGNRVVKGSLQASAGTTAGAGTWTTTSVVDSSSDTAHTSTASAFGFPYDTTGTAGSVNDQTASSGSHTHTWSGINLSSTYPPYYAVGTYKSDGTLTQFPTNTIIFSASNPNTSIWTAAASVNAALENKSIYTPTLAASIGTTGGSLSSTQTITSSTAGAHSHAQLVAGNWRGNSSGTAKANYASNGAHTHAASSLPMTMSQQYIKLKAWINQTSTAPLVSGMIIAYGSSSVSIPTNWYVCNGQTVRGITTPTLTSRYIRITSTSHESTPTIDGLTDVNQWSGSATLGPFAPTHTHYTGGTSTAFTTHNWYHFTTYSWTHNHLVSVTASYEPPSTNLTFIMYIP